MKFIVISALFLAVTHIVAAQSTTKPFVDRTLELMEASKVEAQLRTDNPNAITFVFREVPMEIEFLEGDVIILVATYRTGIKVHPKNDRLQYNELNHHANAVNAKRYGVRGHFDDWKESKDQEFELIVSMDVLVAAPSGLTFKVLADILEEIILYKKDLNERI
jgi:hypothetical protein